MKISISHILNAKTSNKKIPSPCVCVIIATMDYEYFIFDMYGTLVDIHSDEQSARTWKNWIKELDKAGIKHPDFKTMRQDFFARDKEARVKRSYEVNTDFPEIDVIPIYEEMFINYGNEKLLNDLPSKQEFLNKISYEFRKASRDRYMLFDNTAKILGELKKQGKKLYILSNAQRSYTYPEMVELGLTEIMDGMLISSDTGYMKPDRRFFELLIDTYNIPVEKAVMFGDSMLNDVRGAENVGIDAVQTPDGFAAKYMELTYEKN